MLTIAVLAIGLALASCATKQQTGGVAGATLGGAAGYGISGGSFIGTLIGAGVGAAIGQEIGRQMDAADRRRFAYALETQPTGDPYRWQNPDTGYRYTVEPQRTYYGPSGPCREYVMIAYVDGRPEEVRGTACRQQDGTWQAAR